MGLVTQQDPIGIAGGLNLYGYANGDPVNFSDPFGLCVEEDKRAEEDVCTELVAFLRSLDGAVFQRAADAFDAYTGGAVRFVDREALDPTGNVLGMLDRSGDVLFANDLLKGDYAITAVHESRHLPTDLSGGFSHADVPYQYFFDAEYQAYRALPNPGPYAANEHYFKLRNMYPISLIRPLAPRR
jgi:hypothetical protein